MVKSFDNRANWFNCAAIRYYAQYSFGKINNRVMGASIVLGALRAWDR